MHFLHKICHILLLVELVYGSWVQGNNNSSGAYCLEKVEDVKMVTVIKTRTEYVKKFNIMGIRFGKDMPVERDVVEMVPRTFVSTVARCCDGYTRHELANTCVPHCAQLCPENAACTHPDYCECQSGYKEIRDMQQLRRCVDEQKETTLTTLSSSKETTWESSVFETKPITKLEQLEVSTVSEEEALFETTSELGSDIERKSECQLEGCPDNAQCLSIGVCFCGNGNAWTDEEFTQCLPMEIGVIYHEQSIIRKFPLAFATILVGVVLLIIAVALLTRNYLLHRKDEIRIDEEKMKDEKLHCKYVRKNEQSVLVAY